MDNQQKKFKKALIMFCTSLLTLSLLTVGVWGFLTDWGNVNVERLTLTGDDGSILSTLVYYPENATSENPAPAQIIYHGTSSHAHSNTTWALELARRGYVVFSPDMSGGGLSDVIGDRSRQGTNIVEYVASLDIVEDTSGINLVGYSRGVKTIYSVYEELVKQDKQNLVNSMSAIFGNYRWDEADIDVIDTNILLVKAVGDQYDYNFVGDQQALQQFISNIFGFDDELVPNTDYDWKGNLLRYRVIDDAIHQTGNISPAAISEMLEFAHEMNPAPRPLDSNNQVWQWHQLISLFATVIFVITVALLANLLVQTKSLASVKSTPIKDRGVSGRKLYVQLLIEVVLAMLLFIPVTSAGMQWSTGSTVFASNHLNGIVLWLVLVSLIGLVTTAFRSLIRRNKGEKISLADFAMGPEESVKINWSTVGKSFFIGSAVAAFAMFWLIIVEDLFGANYHFWLIAQFNRINSSRFLKALPYLVIVLITNLISNINIFSTRKFSDTGNYTKDTVYAIIRNVIVAMAPIAILLVYQYGVSFVDGTGFAPLSTTTNLAHDGTALVFKTVGALDYSFGYCFLMGGSTAISTYLYRKTNNLWTGYLVSTLFIVFMALSVYTLDF